MTHLTHVFLTRYNLPTPGVERLIRARDGWLRDRTRLFETYTLPSMRRQQGVSFHWVVYLDPASPGWLVARMNELRSEGILRPILRAQVSPEERLRDIQEVTERKHGRLITTNLDNDDGLCNDFAARVQQLADAHTGRNAIYLTNGLVVTSTACYLLRDRSNAFCSVVEDLSGAVTCWADWHNRLGLHMPVVRAGGAPAWLQVIHDANVSNRPRGRLVSPAPYRHSFGGLVNHVSVPNRFRRTTDATIGFPVRYARDQSRSFMRRAAVSTMGKGRYDSFKQKLVGRV